jgi:hypothetical protein
MEIHEGKIHRKLTYKVHSEHRVPNFLVWMRSENFDRGKLKWPEVFGVGIEIFEMAEGFVGRRLNVEMAWGLGGFERFGCERPPHPGPLPPRERENWSQRFIRVAMWGV